VPNAHALDASLPLVIAQCECVCLQRGLIARTQR